MRSVNQWAFRLLQEEKQAISSYFVTLTYDTSKVPISKSGYMSLCYRDVQLFWKRLRKRPTSAKLKYFVVGEYGSKRMRPHYHAIIFNATMVDVMECWGENGDIHFGGVSGASIAYTLKYMLKDSKIPQHAKDDRTREFRKMSKGLGANYLTPEVVQFHHGRPNDIFVRSLQGHTVAMPRFYRNRIFSQADQAIQNRNVAAANSEIQAYAERLHEEKFKKGSVNTKFLEDYERQNSDYKNRKAAKLADTKRGDCDPI